MNVFADGRQPVAVRRLYGCGLCQWAVEAYRAVDNVPTHAHLCRACADSVPSALRTDHYVPVCAADATHPILVQGPPRTCGACQAQPEAWRLGNAKVCGHASLCSACHEAHRLAPGLYVRVEVVP